LHFHGNFFDEPLKEFIYMHFIQRHGGGNFLSKEKKEKQFEA